MPFPLAEALQIDLPTVDILDIGASMVEGADHYAPLVEAGLARVTGFEPNPAELAKLEASGRAHYRYLPYALGNGEPTSFHVTRFPGCSSIFQPNQGFIDRFSAIGASLPDGNFAVVDTVPVQTRRLDDLPEVGQPDYLKLDIQGAERDVLAHGLERLTEAVVIESEVLFVPLYHGQGDFSDLTALLRDQGFQLLELRDVHRCAMAPFLPERTAFPSRGQWMWADAVYVRRYDRLDDWSEDQLLKGAAILHEVYQVYDLVHHLLLEVQLRTGVPLSDRYRAALHADPERAHQWPVLRHGWTKALDARRLSATGALARVG